MISITSAEFALKTFYLGALSQAINTQTNPLFARIDQTSFDVWGKEIRKIVRCHSDGCNHDDYSQLVLPLINLYGTVEFSERTFSCLDSLSVLNSEMSSLLDNCKFNIGRMLYGDGSGILCKVITIDGDKLTVDSARNVKAGMTVDIICNDSEPPRFMTRRISNVDYETKELTFERALPQSVVGGLLTVAGGYQKELTGLGAIFGDSETLYGLTRASNKWLIPRKYVVSEEISNELIQRVLDDLYEVGSEADFIVCSSDVGLRYRNYLSTSGTCLDMIDLQGGYKAISYNGIPVISDRFVPEGTMYILNTSDFHLHQLCDWRWLEGDDGRIIKQVPNKPVYTATLVKYANLICDRPMGQAVVSGIKAAKSAEAQQ